MPADVTVTTQEADLLPSEDRAVIVAVPEETALTVPSELTLATELLEEDQVKVLFVAFEGRTVALSVFDSPTAKLRLAGMLMLSTGTIDEPSP